MIETLKESYKCKSILQEKEKMGWLVLAEKSMGELWNNPKDEKIWKKYLKGKK